MTQSIVVYRGCDLMVENISVMNNFFRAVLGSCREFRV
jgi:hypothetical protein